MRNENSTANNVSITTDACRTQKKRSNSSGSESGSAPNAKQWAIRSGSSPKLKPWLKPKSKPKSKQRSKWEEDATADFHKEHCKVDGEIPRDKRQEDQ